MERRVITDREKEVLRLIAQGYSNRQIAQQLSLSVKTVDAHRANIMRKLQIDNLAGLVKYAIRMGIIDLDE